VSVVPVATARRLFLGAQGLLDDPTKRATPARVYATVERLGYVQIDSIQVVERAHHLVLAARLDGYRPAMLHRLLERDRRLFEHWTHDAAAIPTAWLRYWRPRFARSHDVIFGSAWWRARLGTDHANVAATVLERIRRDGALQSKDFDHDRDGTKPGWWGWTPQKAALEYLWHTGALAVARRVQFQKVYDLAERVLPAVPSEPSADEVRDWACRTALERLEIATPAEIAAFWHAVPIVAARAWCDEAVRRGDAEVVSVEAADGSPPRLAFARAGWAGRARRLPQAPERTRLLAPFDPLVWDRKRARRLFGFDYAFEAFVPAAKRRYGYYVLPILEGERLVGRADPERVDGELRLRRVFWEPGVTPTAARRRALDDAVGRLAESSGLAVAGSARRARIDRAGTAKK
jgi:hypothetical protein